MTHSEPIAQACAIFLIQSFIGNLMTPYDFILCFHGQKANCESPPFLLQALFLNLVCMGQRDGNKLWVLEVCHYTSESRELILIDIFISLEFGNPQQSTWFSDLCVKRQHSQNVRQLRN